MTEEEQRKWLIAQTQQTAGCAVLFFIFWLVSPALLLAFIVFLTILSSIFGGC